MINIEIEEIKKIAKDAGEEILKFYKKEKIDFSVKDNDSPLTKADLSSDMIINNRLADYGFPILSEESHDNFKRLDFKFVWIVDPLDGTSDFIEKTDEFSVLIALVKKGSPILAVVYEPVSKIIYWAEKGKGSFREQDGKIKKNVVSQIDKFSDMKILVSRSHYSKDEDLLLNKLKLEKCQIGSAGIKICRVASGRGDLYFNSSSYTSEWDICAGSLILEEAGGVITDLKDEKIFYNKKNVKNINGFLTSNGRRHKDLLKKINLIK